MPSLVGAFDYEMFQKMAFIAKNGSFQPLVLILSVFNELKATRFNSIQCTRGNGNATTKLFLQLLLGTEEKSLIDPARNFQIQKKKEKKGKKKHALNESVIVYSHTSKHRSKQLSENPLTPTQNCSLLRSWCVNFGFLHLTRTFSLLSSARKNLTSLKRPFFKLLSSTSPSAMLILFQIGRAHV